MSYFKILNFKVITENIKKKKSHVRIPVDRGERITIHGTVHFRRPKQSIIIYIPLFY